MEDNYGYALFVLQKGFSALKIDLGTGSYTQVPVTGYNDWDEITRVFTYDPANNIFYQLQADFIDTPNAPAHNITLYAIDPTTGTTTTKIVQGCSEAGQLDVPGFVFNPNTKKIVMSTYYFQNNQTGYKFYTLDPETAVVTQISHYINDSDSYVGWFNDISADGNTVYRLGYQDVVNQQVSGVGITDISTSTATTRWVADVPLPKGYQFYVSFSVYGDSALSLAPESSGNLNLAQWQIGGNVEVISKLTNAHNTPVFGPIVEYVNANQTIYSALLVQDNVVTDLDKWSVALVSLPGGSSRQVTLSPALYAKLEAAAAFGIPL